MIGIYKITSPSGRIYVGQSINIEQREKQYINNHTKSQPKIHNSIKKYGWQNHLHEIIEECLVDQLNERETYWKQYYLDKSNGDWSMVLFCDLYDLGGGYRSDITKSKMSQSHMGMLKPWVSDYRKGKKQTIQQIQSRTEKLKNKYNPIYQYGMDGKFIQEWDNGKKASIELKLNNGYLWSIIDNWDKTLGGYRFTRVKYESIPKITKWEGNKKPVIQLDLNGEYVKEWESAKDAAISLNIKIQNITACCRDEKKTAYKFIWRYKKDFVY